MMSPCRQEILEKIARLSEVAPELRLGQLIANLAVIAEGPWDETLWHLEDEKMLAAAGQLLQSLDKRTEQVA